MRITKEPKSWVVYILTLYGMVNGRNAVCDQDEWEVMERAHPGRFTLIKSGIRNEAEAERLARGTSGDSVPRPTRGQPVGMLISQPTSPHA